jgi:N-acetylmuramoyl-L-alanine amidase
MEIMKTKTASVAIMLVSISARIASASPEVLAMLLDDMITKTRVSISLSEISEHHVFTLTNPDRVVIDLYSTGISEKALPLPESRGVVRQIRSSKRDDGTLRIVLDLNRSIKPPNLRLAENFDQNENLIIYLVPADAAN